MLPVADPVRTLMLELLTQLAQAVNRRHDNAHRALQSVHPRDVEAGLRSAIVAFKIIWDSATRLLDAADGIRTDLLTGCWMVLQEQTRRATFINCTDEVDFGQINTVNQTIRTGLARIKERNSQTS